MLRKMVENLDVNALRAANFDMKITDFYSMMCKVMAEKYQALVDVRMMFSKRMGHLIGAKNYEIECERVISVDLCNKMVN
jgi:hypothetical protein